MAHSLIEHGTIRTTGPKAKEIRRFAEKIITLAKRGTLQARRRILAVMGDRSIVDAEGELQDKTVVQKLFDEIAPRYADRPGGYTRIIRLSERRIGDAGVQVLLQLVEETPAAEAPGGSRSSRRRARARKRREQVESVAIPAPAESGRDQPEQAASEAAEQPPQVPDGSEAQPQEQDKPKDE